MKQICQIVLLILVIVAPRIEAKHTESTDTILQKTSTKTVSLTWPDDFDNPEQYIGKVIELRQTLYVIYNGSWNKYGEIDLAATRQMAPTEIALPNSQEYHSLVEEYSKSKLTLCDGSNVTYPNPRPWADSDGTLRIGSRTNYIKGTFGKNSYGYTLTPTTPPIFYGNQRPATPQLQHAYNVKVCGFNLEHYIVDYFGTGFGPDNQQESDRQHTKIIKALLAIDADLYGLAEVQLGQAALTRLVEALNQATVKGRYAYINDGTTPYKSYSKVGFIYRTDRLTPHKEVQSNNTAINNRKKAQCFTLNSNGEKFIYIINHFKAKSGSGSGDNADKGDGQGTYNGDRVREAAAVVTFGQSCATYFGDPDILIMGDLNSYSKEDPIRTLEQGGYSNMLRKYHSDSIYSYNYRGSAGCLDHALVNPSLETQTTYGTVYHINTDEPNVFGYAGYSYADNQYRCSDHDPVIITLQLGKSTATPNTEEDKSLIYFDHGLIGISDASGKQMRIISLTGQTLYTTTIMGNDYVIDAAQHGLNNGLYLIELVGKNRRTTNKIIVK